MFGISMISLDRNLMNHFSEYNMIDRLIELSHDPNEDL